jgi:hypothetical protein
MTKLLPISLSTLTWTGCAFSRSPALTLLTLCPILLTGCAHYKVIDADKTVRRLKAHDTFVAPSDGWFVPDARWLDLRQALADKIEQLESTK